MRSLLKNTLSWILREKRHPNRTSWRGIGIEVNFIRNIEMKMSNPVLTVSVLHIYRIYIFEMNVILVNTFQYHFLRLNIKIQDTSPGHIDWWGEWSYTIRNVFREAMGWYHGSIIYNFSFRFPVWYISQSVELWSTLKMWVELNDCHVGDISIFYFLVLAISFYWKHSLTGYQS